MVWKDAFLIRTHSSARLVLHVLLGFARLKRTKRTPVLKAKHFLERKKIRSLQKLFPVFLLEKKAKKNTQRQLRETYQFP